MTEFENWVRKFEDADFIERQRQRIEKLHESLFVAKRIESITFDEGIPDELTAEKYLVMYKKIWALIRHETYNAAQKKMKEDRVSQLDPIVFQKLYKEQSDKFEEYRKEVYGIIMDDTEISEEKCREYMQKAYV